jgi:hypothetical protein
MSNIGKVIELSPFQIKVVELVVDEKEKENQLRGAREMKSNSDMTPRETCLQGYGSEFAFGIMFNLCFDFSVEVKSCYLGTDWGDYVYKGHNVDVKSSKNEWVVPIEQQKVDAAEIEYFAAMQGFFPVYEFKGFIHRNDVFQECNYREPQEVGRKGKFQVKYTNMIDDLVCF